MISLYTSAHHSDISVYLLCTGRKPSVPISSSVRDEIFLHATLPEMFYTLVMELQVGTGEEDGWEGEEEFHDYACEGAQVCIRIAPLL